MPGALREDVMLVSVTRDGQIYFGSDQIDSADLSGKIKNRLKDRGVERKVYINADLRARWGGVKQVLDVVRSAGILRVAFLVNQRAS
jgi:biopolymer transport protein TolR